MIDNELRLLLSGNGCQPARVPVIVGDTGFAPTYGTTQNGVSTILHTHSTRTTPIVQRSGSVRRSPNTPDCHHGWTPTSSVVLLAGVVFFCACEIVMLFFLTKTEKKNEPYQ